MSLGTRLFTFLHGELVGSDGAGNRYYREKSDDHGHDDGRRRKRWVLYAGAPEATAVPPEWHAWLHRITDLTPSESPLPTQSWEKPHEANPTGTGAAYVPSGSLLAGGARPKATGDYEPWRP